MRLTKYTHSCVRLDDADASLVIDPGSYSGEAELRQALDGVDAVLVTHEHPDHLDVASMTQLLAERPSMRVWAPAPVAELLTEARDQVVVVGPGDSFVAGGLPVTTHGGQHALIHRSIPVVPNVAYVVGEPGRDAVLHPGDSLLAVPQAVQTLLLPLHAPWSSVGEVLDHLIAARAPQVHQIHDGLLNERGRTLVEGHVSRVSEEYGSHYRPLQIGQTAD
jgi:L-ascorbate metabolism protein UlaG (beta-lactamase superfamily)